MSSNEPQEDQNIPTLLLSADRVAAALDISVRSLWRLRAAGQLPKPVKIGGSVRWRCEEITQWIADGCPALSRERS